MALVSLLKPAEPGHDSSISELIGKKKRKPGGLKSALRDPRMKKVEDGYDIHLAVT